MLTPAAFEQLVENALAELPREFRQRMRNVQIVIEHEPSDALLDSLGIPLDETLFGLYEGVPITERNDNEALLMPDLITLFQGPLEDACDGDSDALAHEVRHTVMHEIAHHFGISDEQMHAMGVY